MNCNECKSNKSDESFAMELLTAYSKQAHKWFIAFLVVSCFWFATIGGFVWFLNQYNFESYEYTQDGQGINNINNHIGGAVYSGAETQR